MAFRKLELIEPILKALADEGYTTPTPIQQQSIPLILERKDLLGCAQTGTGKTAAFAIPILQLLYQDKPTERGPKHIKALILTPTRELAIQIGESFAAYGKYTGITHTVIFGGVSQMHQTNQLQRGVDILIATPGRLLDLMSQGYIGLQHLKIFVLTNGLTFSASTIFCNAVKDQSNVTLVGEETGGGWYGNSGLLIPDITLPKTKLRVRLPFFKIVQFNHVPKNGRGVTPDIFISPTVESVRKGIDRKMEFVNELIKNNN